MTTMTGTLSYSETLPDAPTVRGFVRRIPTVRVEPDLTLFPDLAPNEGAEGLWAEIDDITFEEKGWIPYGEGVQYRAIWAEIWPYVRAWNVMARNRETKQFEPLPPPAEAGPDVFSRVAPITVAAWLALELKFGHVRSKALDEKKASTASTPEPSNATDSSSSPKRSSKSGTKPRGGSSTNDRPTTTS